MHNNKFQSMYSPILSLSPSEMGALEELPGKDKDLILPVISLKGWTTSKKLCNSLDRISKAIGERAWIANIDRLFLTDNKEFQFTGKYPRDVFYELEELLSPSNGYEKWCDFIASIPNAIPCLLLDDLEELPQQLMRLKSLDKGVVVIFEITKITRKNYDFIVDTLEEKNITDIFIIYDLGTLSKGYKDYIEPLSDLIKATKNRLFSAKVSVSGTSFPSSFSGSHKGENPIYERLLFNKVNEKIHSHDLIYSDHGSARIEKQLGGGGIPSPRIDYPLKNDWRFIRNEFQNTSDLNAEEKKELYKLCAQQIMLQQYWKKDLFLWGTQMIELTAKGEKFGINSPQKSTAVRINIHLYTQLHYNENIDEIDTDEEWED